MLVAPGVHHFETFPFNWYLIEDGDRFTLVDAGFPGHYDAFVAGLRSINREPKDVKAIVLTHAHADHTGFAERLRGELDIPVFVHEDELQAFLHLKQAPPTGLLLNAWRPFVLRNILFKAVTSGAPQSQSIKTATSFRHGDVLDIPGRPRVIHAPGHTAGHAMLHLQEKGVIFSGDAIVTINLLTGENVGPCVPPGRVNEDFDLAHRSVAKLEDLGNFTLLPGHGPAWKGNMEQLMKAVRVNKQ